MANLTETLGTDLVLKSDMMVTPSGDLDLISGLDNIQLALFHRLVTSPGALVHRPNYGVGIKDYQNAPGSLTVYRALAQRISEQFVQDPRVSSVLGVSITQDETNPYLFVLVVRADIIGYGEQALQFTPFSEGV